MTDPTTHDPTSPDAPATVSPFVAQRLLELCIALGTPRDIGDLLAVILDATTDLLDCGRASILLYDTTARQLRFVAATSQETEMLAQIPVPLHGSLAGTIFRENRPLVVGDVQRDTEHFSEPAEATGYRPRAIAGVPMRIDGQPVGVLEALDPHEGAFT
ncbi:MAG TPA: GAF domain-containing protein, partial [Rubricoccaceae bacterium]